MQLRLVHAGTSSRGADPGLSSIHLRAASTVSGQRGTAEEVLAAFETVSRRMEDLACELDCFGFFDDRDDDRPRAA